MFEPDLVFKFFELKITVIIQIIHLAQTLFHRIHLLVQLGEFGSVGLGQLFKFALHVVVHFRLETHQLVLVLVPMLDFIFELGEYLVFCFKSGCVEFVLESMQLLGVDLLVLLELRTKQGKLHIEILLGYSFCNASLHADIFTLQMSCTNGDFFDFTCGFFFEHFKFGLYLHYSLHYAV